MSTDRQPAVWWQFSIAAHDLEIFYVPRSGWTAIALGYHEGIGPYFSLPEALRRAEQIVGEAAWKPCMITQREESWDPGVAVAPPPLSALAEQIEAAANYQGHWMDGCPSRDTVYGWAAAVRAVAPPLPHVEIVAAAVHDAWMAQKRAKGITSALSQQTGEEQMRQYAELSDAVQEYDRATVRAVYAAIEALRAVAPPPPTTQEWECKSCGHVIRVHVGAAFPDCPKCFGGNFRLRAVAPPQEPT